MQAFGFEKEPDNLKANVCIQNISKVIIYIKLFTKLLKNIDQLFLFKEFRTGFKTKRVVNNLSVNFYENQITGLLGHNGAGNVPRT